METGGGAHFDFDSLFDPDDYLYFYEETLAEENTPGQVDFLTRELRMEAPMRVLDLGCGHGRHANELASRGYAVVGVDIVQRFLEIAEREAQARGLPAQFVLGDIRGLPWEEEFDRAICLFDVLGFFRDEENAAVLAGAARALRPGGMLCVDVRNRDWMVRNLLPVTVLEKGDDLMIDRHHFDTVTGRLVDRRLLVRDGVVKRRPFSIRLYTGSELSLMLEAAGLRVAAAFGSYEGAPISMQQNRMVIIAQKPG
jgi:SAM-dependent methyltransferase